MIDKTEKQKEPDLFSKAFVPRTSTKRRSFQQNYIKNGPIIGLKQIVSILDDK